MENKLLSFREFEGIYESYGFVTESADAVAAAPAPTKTENSVLTKEGEPKEDVADLLSLFKKLAEELGVKEAEDPKINTLKPVKMGETSDRVKEIQKLLGLKDDGQYGVGTQKAVIAFQKENKIKIDGVDIKNIIWTYSINIPEYPEPWASEYVTAGNILEKEVIGATKFGHNGIWYLDFTSPFYIYIMQWMGGGLH